MNITMSTNSIKERERALAWFTAASATYLDLGLTTEQRHLLYEECLAISKKHGDEKLLRLCNIANIKVEVAEMNAHMTLGEAHLKKEEYDDAILYSKKCLSFARETGHKVAQMNAYMILGRAHFLKEEYDDAILCSKKCLVIAQESGDKMTEMNAYMTLGAAHFLKEEYDDVILYSKKCLASAQKSGDKVAEMNAHMTLGEAHLKKKEYDDAILYSKKCLVIAQESGYKMTEMNAYIKLWLAHLMKNEYADVMFYSKKCLSVAGEIGNKVAEMPNAYMILETAHLLKEEYDDAILYSKKYLVIARETGDKVSEMKAYLTLGKAHLKKEEYDDAISYSKKCLAITKESGLKESEMNAYMTLGAAHLGKEEYDDAIFYSKKCLDRAQETGHKVAEMNAYVTLGEAYLKKEEYDDAILYSRKCLAIAQESGDKVAEMNAYITLGEAYLKKEEYDGAILYSRKCLAIAQESGHKVAEMNAYLMLGEAYLKKEEYDDAHSCITEGMVIAINLKDGGNVVYFSLNRIMILEAVGIVNFGDEDSLCTSLHAMIDKVSKQSLPSLRDWIKFYSLYTDYRREYQYEQAISSLKKAEVVAIEARRNRANMVSALLLWTCKYKISEMYLLLAKYEEALHYQQEALDVACKEGTKSNQAMSHLSLGEIYYKLEQFENAEKSFKKSLKFYELIFDGLKQNDQFKIAFVDKLKKAYKMLLKVLIETNKKEEALVVSDHYRARALKDLLVSSYGMKKEQLPKEGLQYVDVQSLVSSSNYTLLFYSTCFEKLCTFVVGAREELQYSVQYFKYCDTCLEELVYKTFDEMEVGQVLNCEDRSLDGVTDDHEENKNPEEDELTQLLTRQIEERLSEECRSTCGNRGEPSENSDENSLTSGLEKLYHKLIHNIKNLIKQDEIVIIPDGPLCKVPFAALRDPDTGQYLSETKRIRMAPSMASLKLLQELPIEHHSKKEALIIGASLVRGVMLDGKDKDFDYLGGALNEAKDIGHILGVCPLLEELATKPGVLAKLQEGASIVHIAAHGHQQKATIVLAPSPDIRDAGKIPNEEDYMLTMAEVQAIQVRAQLVVLSCCHSGRGEIKAEGVVGMCRAFLASGARAVVGSLWVINDIATRGFMKTFYTYLKGGKSASTSLHLTMNDMRRQYSEPRYWAPFFLMGDDVTPFPVKIKDQHSEDETYGGNVPLDRLFP